jgi:hypothetical protein
LKSNYEGILQSSDTRKAQGYVDAKKMVAIWNARQPAGEPCGSIQRRAITSKLPARQHAAHLSSPDDRHNLRNRASVPGRRTTKSLAAIHDPVESPHFT